MLRICLNAHIELAEMQVFSVSINRKKDIERASHEKGGKEINHYMVYFLFIYKLDKIDMVAYSILGLLANPLNQKIFIKYSILHFCEHRYFNKTCK